MDLGKASTDDKNLVKTNQSTPANPAPSSANPSIPTGQVSVNDVNSDKSLPINQTPPPSDEPKMESDNMGVGKPNIGVELEDTASEPPAEPPKPPAPPTPPPPPEPTSTPTAAPPTPATDPTPPTPPPPTPVDSDGSVNVPINKYSNNVSVDSQEEAKQPPVFPANPNPAPAQPAFGSAPVPPTPAAPPSPAGPTPPIKAHSNATAIVAVLAVFALVAGGAGGFFGFKYLDRIKSSADTLTPEPSASSSTIAASTKSYESSKYGFSLSYPSNWFSSTTDTQADSIILASDQATLTATTPTGYKVTIGFQSNNGKNLKDWVDANQVTSGETQAPTQITVSGSTAYQQILSASGSGTATYIPLSDHIMVVTYTAPADKLSAGGTLYNQIIKSIKVTG